MIAYERPELGDEERDSLQRVYHDLLVLANCPVPSVRASARAALAHIAQAMNGQGISFDLYTAQLER